MKLKSYLRGLGVGMIVTTIILVIAFQSRRKTMTDEEIMSKAHALGMVETSMFSGNKEENGTIQVDSSKNNATEPSGEGLVDKESTAAENITTTAATNPTTTSASQTVQTTTAKPTEKATTKPTETTTAKSAETTTAKPVETTTSKPVETTAKPTEVVTEKPTEKVTEKPTEKPTEAPTQPVNKEITLLFDNITSADKASKILYQAGIIQDVESFNKYLSDKGWATKVGEGEFTFKQGMTFEEIAKIITRQK